ncbi:uncharacterized protein BX664DRAFT_341546 [Halteromyces radiatus]|uniref:uncharacterized protein n=1 Tax=Halteromyces radiatus TaxID=101107 RepID=UPI00221F6CDA|nr:uncharacterized protein BX664DRAFT_341546 [Halteromyces radiatus]KAI8079825.1 hypothetical protein BX664DRAFT_341546 [Halteromyces radiatus]
MAIHGLVAMIHLLLNTILVDFSEVANVMVAVETNNFTSLHFFSTPCVFLFYFTSYCKCTVYSQYITFYISLFLFFK